MTKATKKDARPKPESDTTDDQEQWGRFERLTRKLVGVAKKEIDDKRKERSN
jgi:hypothetical protein